MTLTHLVDLYFFRYLCPFRRYECILLTRGVAYILIWFRLLLFLYKLKYAHINIHSKKTFILFQFSCHIDLPEKLNVCCKFTFLCKERSLDSRTLRSPSFSLFGVQNIVSISSSFISLRLPTVVKPNSSNTWYTCSIFRDFNHFLVGVVEKGSSIVKLLNNTQTSTFTLL